MKKLLIIVVSLLLVGMFALAEIDLTSLSDDELIDLKKNVEAMLEQRGITQEKEITQGVYTIGESIVPGGYRFIAHETTSTWIYLGLFNSANEVYNDGQATFEYCLTSDGDSIHLDLEEGKVLFINTPSGSCTYIPD